MDYNYISSNKNYSGANSGLESYRNQCQDRYLRGYSPERERSNDNVVQMWKAETKMIYNNFDKQQHNSVPVQQFEYGHQKFPAPEQPVLQQTPVQSIESFPPYGYSVSDHYDSDSNQRSFPTIPPCRGYSLENIQSSSNQLDIPLSPNHMRINDISLPVYATGIEMMMSTATDAAIPVGDDLSNTMKEIRVISLQAQKIIPFPVKEKITLPSCTLYPPPPGQQIKYREKQPNCKIIFIGYMPRKTTEEILREIFICFGEVDAVIMIRSFAYVRFTDIAPVDKAMTLSGYRLQIGNKDDSAHSSIMYVDYATARDEYEVECLDRSARRKARHEDRAKHETWRPLTPPPVPTYNVFQMHCLSKRLKSETKFKGALHILATWLEKGNCNRKTCDTFYSMLQSVSCHFKKLTSEKVKLDLKFIKSKTEIDQKLAEISSEYMDIYKLFVKVHMQKTWKLFSKSQKKNIEAWKSVTLEIIRAHSKELVEQRVDEEMDLSDNEDDEKMVPNSSSDIKKRVTEEDVRKLRKEVEAARNSLQSTLKEIVNIKTERYLNSIKHTISSDVKYNTPADQSEQTKYVFNLTHQEVHIVTLIANFLNGLPFGANSHFIWSHFKIMYPSINIFYIDSLLQKFPNLFKEQFLELETTSEKTWLFIGFNHVNK